MHQKGQGGGADQDKRADEGKRADQGKREDQGDHVSSSTTAFCAVFLSFLQPLLSLEIIVLNLRLCIFFSVD